MRNRIAKYRVAGRHRFFTLWVCYRASGLDVPQKLDLSFYYGEEETNNQRVI